MGILESLCGRPFNSPASYSGCKSCEYRATEAEEAQGLRSGFKECWTRHYGWSAADFTLPNTFEVWNFRKGEALLQKEQKIFLKDLSPEDIGYKPEAGKLSTTERQWLQIEKAVSGDAEAYVLKEELQAEMASFEYPLNFIDFETSATALPFNKGRRPYEQVAFQFSHHTLDAAGKVSHESEYIHFEPGQFPNFEFVRALKKALEKNRGSIFRYSNHENSILCAIHQQLAESQEPDREALQAFIRGITTSTSNSTHKWQGERNMIDLCRLVKDYYYHPLTRGSNSIKAVLPAMLATSPYLQQKYSQPLGAIGLSSRNFGQEHRWLQRPAGESVQAVATPLFRLDQGAAGLHRLRARRHCRRRGCAYGLWEAAIHGYETRRAQCHPRLPAQILRAGHFGDVDDLGGICGSLPIIGEQFLKLNDAESFVLMEETWVIE